ncbi:peptide methionine sulfoxide reductase [Paracidovorax avenae ATCC 19860]|uniref:Peptide methionine sulfoxide reductase MsrA n=1 Tax=Paracidovorax avenae (strain ATCC 19860 / DSM 7227 / CCUG 15838 / JCM 20985 / LMG 2117 / NCPPB 1011) TaxID=643561 RepID=F0QDA7_PARA1|nr:peptide-methionine (S)-S-oxide reductase MsrA [Paracidovorax avenae]ADX46352.1 peptide methionine sulfoxide reductase [Paracidovorax avenae ATCC 19860]
MESPDNTPSETITLGGGCFWCTEAVFDRVRGVTDVENGYANGQVPHPTYEQVCSGRTGHAEVVRLTFDPKVIGLREILEIFFATHDPTTLNRQGNDVGTQYRSGIYTATPAQQELAEDMVRQMSQDRLFGAPIVTEVQPLESYWPAEDYHQDYYLNHPEQGYCAFVVGPKVEKFRKTFARYLKPE